MDKPDWSPSPQDAHIEHLERELIAERRRLSSRVDELIAWLKDNTDVGEWDPPVVADTRTAFLEILGRR